MFLDKYCLLKGMVIAHRLVHLYEAVETQNVCYMAQIHTMNIQN